MNIKTLLSTLLLMLLSIGVHAQNEKEPYVVIDEEGTATFYYKDSKPKGALPLQSSYLDDNWSKATCKSVTKVVFDASFKDYTPTNCNFWFYDFTNLTEISGMKENLNTVNVTTIIRLFENCSSLTTIDVSNFNTEKVTDMFGMFDGCSGLTTLDVSNFNTAKVTSMSFMFNDCSSLTTLDLSNFNTTNVKDMYCMFSDCSNLTTLDLSNFNTANVTRMEQMFSHCFNLISIFVGNDWTTDAVKTSSDMFSHCRFLYGGKGTSYDAFITDATYAKIDGGKGAPGYFTKSGDPVYDGPKPYVIIKDGIATFYYKNTPEGALPIQSSNNYSWPNAICNSVTKVVFDDSFKNCTPTSCDSWFSGFNNLTEISGMKENLNTANVKNMSDMFDGCSSLTSIDLSNFNTAKVIQMGGMFAGCSNLTTLDLSNFNTANVTNMGYMFNSCSSLTSIDLSNFNTAKVTNMSTMFSGCISLTTLDLRNFNTANVTTMQQMFLNCSSITTLDLSSFNTKKVTSISSIFSSCRNLNDILVGDDWSTAAVPSSYAYSMFYDCTSLYGGKGTPYNADFIDATYAKIDGGKDAPGYFTKSGDPVYDGPKPYVIVKDGTATFYYKSKPDEALPLQSYNNYWSEATLNSVTKVVFDASFKDYLPTSCAFWFCNFKNLTEISDMKENLNTANVTDMRDMFYECNSLTTLDLSNFNTANVKDMYCMFVDCRSLITLDLSNFNTDNVTNMEGMFSECSFLSAIFVDDNWSIAEVTNSSSMFSGCRYLYGGKGTEYHADIVDASYAKIDGGKDAPGYFTKSGEPAFEKVVVSIEITTAPKTQYVVGEDFSANGGYLTLTYNNGTTSDIYLSSATITGYDSNNVGEQTLKVKYKGVETTLTVTVATPTPVSSTATTPNIKVWSSNRIIYIEAQPGIKYTILETTGRILKTSYTRTNKDEIRLNQKGIFIVYINNKTYKVILL